MIINILSSALVIGPSIINSLGMYGASLIDFKLGRCMR